VVEATLQKVASKCAPGSCIAFDYFGPWSLQPGIQKKTSQSGEAFLFAVDAADAEILIRDKSGGLTVWDHLHDTEILTECYLTRHCNGEAVGFLGDGFGGFIVARKEAYINTTLTNKI
jgi:hypothetical protein